MFHMKFRKDTFSGIILLFDFVFLCFILFKGFNIEIHTLCIYFLFNLISIILPGLAICSFMNIKITCFQRCCMAYILGYVVIVLEYFASELFDRSISFAIISIFTTAISLVIFIWKIRKKIRINNSVEGEESEVIEVVFFTLFLMFNIFAYAANYLGTDVVPVFKITRDMQYWVNNTVALKISWPADNLFMLGNALNYHYFSNIPIAFLSEIYKIDVFTLSFPLYILSKTIILIGAVHFLVDSIKSNKKNNVICYILLLCTTGIEEVSNVTYVHHILLAPFGFDIGYAYGIVFIAFLIRQWKKEKFDLGLYIGTMLVWVMCVGAKAPIALILILFVAFTCFYWLVQKCWKMAFGYGLSVLAIFLVICKYCVGMFSVVSGDAAWSLSLYNLSDIAKLEIAEASGFIMKFMSVLGGMNPIFALAIRIFLVNPAMVIGASFSVVIICYFIKQKHVSGKDIYLYCILGLTALWGLTLGIVVNAGGYSEMYFSMTALIPMFVIILLVYEDYKGIYGFNIKNKMKYKNNISIIMGMLMLIGVYYFLWSARANVGAVRSSLHGLTNLYHAKNVCDYSDWEMVGIRDTDVEALNWIRDNAETDAIIMTDKAIISGNSAYYLYGIFCERQQYIEGTNMLDLAGKDLILQNEIQARKELVTSVYYNENGAIERAKNEGIDYIVQTVDITPDFIYDEEWLDLVESSETINVYKIK